MGRLLLLGRILAVEFLAELDELALEGLEAVGYRVGDVGVIHRRLGQALLPLPLDDPTGDADDRGVWRDRLQHHRVGPDLDVVPDLDPAEDLRPGPYHYMIAQRWVALAPFLARAPQRDPLKQSHVIADFGRLADDDAHPMADEKAAPDLRGRMDLDPGQPARELGDGAGDERDAPRVQPVRDPVRQ